MAQCEICEKKLEGSFTVQASYGKRGEYYKAEHGKGICDNCLEIRRENFILEQELLEDMEDGFSDEKCT